MEKSENLQHQSGSRLGMRMSSLKTKQHQEVKTMLTILYVPDSKYYLNTLSKLGLKAKFKRDLNQIFKAVYRKYEKTEQGRGIMMAEIAHFVRERAQKEYTCELDDNDFNLILKTIFSFFCARYDEYQQRTKERQEKFDAGLEKSLRAGYTNPNDKESIRAGLNARIMPGSAYSNLRKH